MLQYATPPKEEKLSELHSTASLSMSWRIVAVSVVSASICQIEYVLDAFLTRDMCVAHVEYQHSPTLSYDRSHTLTMSQPSASVSMSQMPATTCSSLDIERIFDTALKSYKKKTRKDLKNHDHFKQLEKCDSPAAILAVFQATHFDQSRTGADDRLKKWLVPTINVLCAFSDALGEGVSLVNSNSSVPLSANTF